MNRIFKGCKKVWLWRPSVKVIAGWSVALFAVMMLPLLRIALYSVPYYDDYNYGSFAKLGMESIGGLVGALRGAVECVRVQWHAWQGTYTSVFFMALMPGIWGEDKYFWGPVFLLILLPVAIFVLVKVLVRDILKADLASCVVMQVITAAMVVMLIYSSQAGFYWYNAGFHYVGMHSICILFVSVLICLLHVRKKMTTAVFIFLSMVGALMVAGGNFVTALQGMVLLLFIGVLGFLIYRKRAFLLLPALGVYIVGFCLNVMAPGNDKRAVNFEGWGYSPIEAILRSFLEAFKHLGEFTGLITLAILIMLVPVIWQMVKKSNFAFRYPGLVLLISFCLYATGFAPSLYSLGHAGLSRTLNAVKITYQLLLILNEVYWLGWLSKRLTAKGKMMPEGKAFWWFYPIMGEMMLLIFSIAPNQAGCYSAYGAYYYIHTGEAHNFYQQYQERVEILKSDRKDVVLTPYRYKPWLLCIGDLSVNPDNEENRAVADWYGKTSVIVKSES